MLSLPQLLLVGAALGFCCTIGYAILPFPPLAEKIGFSPLASILAIRHPGVIVVGVLLMCQSGNEAGIGGWMSTYAGSIGATPKIATWILAGYWAALMLGRIAGARILRLVPKRRMVLMSGLGSAAGAAVILAANSIAVLAAGAVLIGASFATVYPTMLAIVADRYHRLAGTIFSLLFAMGLCGGMLFPWVMGHVSQSASLRVAMTVPLAGALIICVLAVVQSRD